MTQIQILYTDTPTFPTSWASMNTLLSHDWLTGMRGGERVLELLCQGFPKAPIYTLIHQPSRISEAINSHAIHASMLQHVPGIMKYYRYFLPVMPWMASRPRLPEADLLISTSHCVAKGVKKHTGTKHLCYCFTPMRYAWALYSDYFGENSIKKVVLKPTLHAIRSWDKRTSKGVDRFVAISQHVQKRIKRYYDRESDIVYPPVATHYYTPGESSYEGYDLIVSALVPYKRVDLAVRAYNRLGYPLKIVGTGTEYESLKKSASENIDFLGWESDETIRDLYRGCRMLIFPGEEDFGIVPVEAQACGKPVVAFKKGGALETIVDGKTGIFFDEQTEESLLNAIEEAHAMKWDAGEIARHAETFSIQAFLVGLEKSIQLMI